MLSSYGECDKDAEFLPSKCGQVVSRRQNYLKAPKLLIDGDFVVVDAFGPENALQSFLSEVRAILHADLVFQRPIRIETLLVGPDYFLFSILSRGPRRWSSGTR